MCTARRARRYKTSGKTRWNAAKKKQEIQNHRHIEQQGEGQTKGGLHIFTVDEGTGSGHRHASGDEKDLTFIPGLPNVKDHNSVNAPVGRLNRNTGQKPFVFEIQDEEAEEPPAFAPQPKIRTFKPVMRRG